MKLLLCVKCSDVRSLPADCTWVECRCALVRARYADSINAEWNGEGHLLGFANGSLVTALIEQKDLGDRKDGMGRTFTAFIIPRGAPSVRILP